MRPRAAASTRSTTEGDGSALYAARARFFSVEEGFNIERAPLRPTTFTAERDRAFASATSTGVTWLDCSATLGLSFPATTPLLLAGYITLGAGESFETRPRATGEIYVALAGAGWSGKGQDRLAWEAGDIFCLPGSDAPTIHHADADAVLYAVSDEPALRFAGAGAPASGQSPIEAVLYPKALTDARLQELRLRELPPDAPGRALNLSSRAMERLKTCLPGLTLTFNLVPPGERQRPHRHNAAALVLVLKAGGCHSLVDGQRLDWSDNAVVLTPAGAVHSHENAAEAPWALALIVQDGGLHYHCRTMGFAYA